MDQPNDHTTFQPSDPEKAAQYATMIEAAEGAMLMFHALIEAGFNEAQALTLVGAAFGGQR